MTLLGDGVAIITGAASGIGRATAIVFANDGCIKLMLGDLSMVAMEETRRLVFENHPEAQTQLRKLDISDEASVESFYDAAAAHFGRTDYAANVAGTAGRRVRLSDGARHAAA